MLKYTPNLPAVGDIWFRVNGVDDSDGPFDEEMVELAWEEWRCVKVTACGGWFECITWPYRTREKKKFADASARWIKRTRAEALKALLARKRRHLAIMDYQTEVAKRVQVLATEALAEEKSSSAALAKARGEA